MRSLTTLALLIALLALVAVGKTLNRGAVAGTSLTTIAVTTDGFYDAFPGLVKWGGNFVVVYRKGMRHAGVKGTIVKKVSSDGGMTWSAESTVYSDAVYDVRDPQIIKRSNGDLLVIFIKQDPGPPIATLHDGEFVMKSTDGGETWGTPVQVDSAFTGFSASSGPIVELGNGDLLISLFGKNVGDAFWSASVVKSTDGGATWGSEVIIGNGVTDLRDYQEPNLLKLQNGNILCMIRTQGGVFYQSTSTDSGATWPSVTSAFTASGAPRMAQFTSGRIVIFYRRQTGANQQIVAKHSSDNGTTWSTNELAVGPDPFVMYYASAFENSPGQLALVWAQERTVGQGTGVVPCDLFFRYFDENEIAAPTAASSSVSGRITDVDGRPVEGVAIVMNGTEIRKTITDSSGYYQFNDVETSGFYSVTPSRANYSFSPSSRSFSQLGSHTDAAFSSSFVGDTTNPLDAPEYFVRQLYVDVLGHEPDESGFNFWTDQILACNGAADCISSRRVDVASAFFVAQEFQQTGPFIYNIYSSALGRRPTFDEFAKDRQRVVAGPSLDSQKAAFTQDFVKRPEFVQKYGNARTAKSFVHAILKTVRRTSGLDLTSLVGPLLVDYQKGHDMNQSRGLVLNTIAANGTLAQAQYNSAFVLTEYFAYLRRDPSPAAYDFWLRVIDDRAHRSYRIMVCTFVTSAEYQRRFSSVVTHSTNECGTTKRSPWVKKPVLSGF
jgi:hypothetical protein